MATAASAISSSTFAGQSVIKTQSELSRKVANVDARVSMRRNLKSTPGSQISSSEGGLGDTERRRTGTMATTTTTTTVRAAQNAAAIVSAMSGGTPVRSTSILVVGATGTLGRQVVRRALDEGYDVRCLVRSRPAPADFLRDWGATVFNVHLRAPSVCLSFVPPSVSLLSFCKPATFFLSRKDCSMALINHRFQLCTGS
jgi:hypothetical protein